MYAPFTRNYSLSKSCIMVMIGPSEEERYYDVRGSKGNAEAKARAERVQSHDGENVFHKQFIDHR